MTVAEMEAKAGHLMAAHWAEVEGDRAPLCVNWDRFREFEDLGLVMIQGAYVDDELVGYCVLTLNVHLFEDAKPARISAIYVDPGRRSGCPHRRLVANPRLWSAPKYHRRDRAEFAGRTNRVFDKSNRGKSKRRCGLYGTIDPRYDARRLRLADPHRTVDARSDQWVRRADV